MRAVRCDVCGAKAMMAAAKCPSCGHLFELRDGFGELLPLSYCSSCASYYPESVGSCKWCGTKPDRPPIDPRILRGAGIGVAAVVAAVWLLQNRAPKEDVSHQQAKTATKTPAAAAPLDSDSAVARAIAVANDSLASLTVALSDTARRDSTASPTPTSVTVDTTTKAVAPPSLPATARSVTTAATARRAPRWVRSVSRHWVVVRAGASRESRIIASIGPNSRVELGESRGDWRRIRAKGIAGWVEPRSSFELASAR